MSDIPEAFMKAARACVAEWGGYGDDAEVEIIAMLIRLVTEGDQINGVTPPSAMLAAKEG